MTASIPEVTYEQLQAVIKKGFTIRWCGMLKGSEILVQISRNGNSSLLRIDVNNVFDSWSAVGTIRNGEATSPYTDVGYAPSNVDSFGLLRKATVLGINTSGDCYTGCAKQYQLVEGCTCGYDIELDLRNQERGGFPLPSVPILSVALWCNCGYKYFISTLDISREFCVTVSSQSELVSVLIREVSNHQPLWLVGWNCYSFDNTCLLYQADETHANFFRRVKIGSASTVDYGYILDIPGVYNVDPFGYMQRSPAYIKGYSDLSLHGVASRLKTKLKTEMPDLYTVSSPVEIMEYNMNDSAVAAEIWVKTGLVILIPCLAVLSCSHVYDCIRHMTSVMARCPLTTEAMSLGMMIDWSPCSTVLQYQGGKVLEPLRGVHSSVAVCDYSSMYPTIMIDGRISPETLVVQNANDRPYGDVWWNDEHIYVRLDDRIARFPRSGDSVQRSILMKMNAVRSQNRKANPIYADALKVASNSMYGAIGYQNSPMYSPSCSSSVTAIGRWCLDLACRVFEDNGMKVIYGDTDSCFVKATRETAKRYNGNLTDHVDRCLAILKLKLSRTPFSGMTMCLESTHDRVLLVEKKKYCTTAENGNVKYKGMSIVRRDTLGICKKACEVSCRAVLYKASLREASDEIARFISHTVSAAINGTLSHSDVSKVVKRNQKRCYVYIGSNGEEREVPIEMSANTVPDYSTKRVLESLRSEILRVTVPCGLGTLSDIMSRFDELL